MKRLICVLLFSSVMGCVVGAENNSNNDTPKISSWSMQVRKPWASGPHPTVIVGHGCDGLRDNPGLFDWAKELNSWGYNAVFYDSFAYKGYNDGRICYDGTLITPEYRAREAELAAKWIKEQSWHKGKVFYVGESHGGATAILIAKKSNSEISAVVAMYPWCHSLGLGALSYNKEIDPPSWGHFMKIPTQLHMGEKDDWTPPNVCDDVKNADKFLYSNSTHAFDFDYPDRKLWGHFLKYNKEATKLSRERIKKFLETNS